MPRRLESKLDADDALHVGQRFARELADPAAKALFRELQIGERLKVGVGRRPETPVQSGTSGVGSVGFEALRAKPDGDGVGS